MTIRTMSRQRIGGATRKKDPEEWTSDGGYRRRGNTRIISYGPSPASKACPSRRIQSEAGLSPSSGLIALRTAHPFTWRTSRKCSVNSQTTNTSFTATRTSPPCCRRKSERMPLSNSSSVLMHSYGYTPEKLRAAFLDLRRAQGAQGNEPLCDRIFPPFRSHFHHRGEYAPQRLH